MHDLQPLHGILGGVLIALALAVMLIATGRVAGLSGIIGGLVASGDRTWRAWYVVGMFAVGAVFAIVQPSAFDAGSRLPLPVVAIGGALVGFGTRLCNGCTSGHGLCGLSRLSRRSITATLTFFGIAVVTATLTGALR